MEVHTTIQPSGCASHRRADPERPKCSCKRLIVPRRIHALLGAWITAFLGLHIAVAVCGMWPERFQRSVDAAQALRARFPGIELLAILVPVLLQILSGVHLLWREGIRYRVKKCNRGGQMRFFLQRTTGLVILAYLVLHVGTLHDYGFHLLYRATHTPALGRFAERGLFVPQGVAFRSTAAAFRTAWDPTHPFAWQNTALMGFALAGILSTIFHAANGAWSGALVWNFLSSEEGKRRWAVLCLILGITLASAGTLGWYAFTLAATAGI